MHATFANYRETGLRSRLRLTRYPRHFLSPRSQRALTISPFPAHCVADKSRPREAQAGQGVKLCWHPRITSAGHFIRVFIVRAMVEEESRNVLLAMNLKSDSDAEAIETSCQTGANDHARLCISLYTKSHERSSRYLAW